jgi:hypothetical protein
MNRYQFAAIGIVTALTNSYLITSFIKWDLAWWVGISTWAEGERAFVLYITISIALVGTAISQTLYKG